MENYKKWRRRCNTNPTTKTVVTYDSNFPYKTNPRAGSSVHLLLSIAPAPKKILREISILTYGVCCAGSAMGGFCSYWYRNLTLLPFQNVSNIQGLIVVKVMFVGVCGRRFSRLWPIKLVLPINGHITHALFFTVAPTSHYNVSQSVLSRSPERHALIKLAAAVFAFAVSWPTSATVLLQDVRPVS